MSPCTIQPLRLGWGGVGCGARGPSPCPGFVRASVSPGAHRILLIAALPAPPRGEQEARGPVPDHIPVSPSAPFQRRCKLSGAMLSGGSKGRLSHGRSSSDPVPGYAQGSKLTTTPWFGHSGRSEGSSVAPVVPDGRCAPGHCGSRGSFGCCHFRVCLTHEGGLSTSQVSGPGLCGGRGAGSWHCVRQAHGGEQA